METILDNMARMSVELDAKEKASATMECRDVLKLFAGRVGNLSVQLSTLVLKSRSPQSELMLAVSDEVIRVLDGNMRCFEYSQKRKAEQDLYIFNSTHWRKVEKQDYQDFVRDCAERTGLQDQFLHKPSFMNGLFEQIAMRIMGSKVDGKPKNEVWMNFRNVTVEIKADGQRVVREHRREDYFMYVLPYAYNPDAACPQFHSFLEYVLPDASVRQLIREYLAAAFIKDFNDETVLNCIGGGGNGKSTLFSVIQHVFGEENYAEVTLTDLTNSDERRSRIEHKLLNFSEEADPKIDISMFKRLASRQAVTIERKYKDSYEMKDYARIICACNTLPQGESNYAFYRRNLVVPFNVVVPREKADKQLRKKLLEELPGICCWLMDCLPELMQRQAFSPCQVAEQALEEYMAQLDSVRVFFSRCVPSEEYPTPSSELFSSYTQMCYEENLTRIGKSKFFKQIEQLMGRPRIVGHSNKSSFPLHYKSES